jgi:hypothetical protein
MEISKKMKYEKPVSIDAGSVAPVFGARCSDGNSADIGTCSNGFNDNLQPLCHPTGLNATGNCEIGNGAVKACGTGNTPGWGCYSGSSPHKLSQRFG